MQQTPPVTQFILNLVARLREASAQLARSARSPLNPADLMNLASKLTNGNQRLGPKAEARVSVPESSAESGAGQEQGNLAAKVSALVAASGQGGDLDDQQALVGDNEAAGSALTPVTEGDPSEGTEEPDGDAAESEGDSDSEEATLGLDENENSDSSEADEDSEDGGADQVPDCRDENCDGPLQPTLAVDHQPSPQQIDQYGQYSSTNDNVHGAGSTSSSGGGSSSNFGPDFSNHHHHNNNNPHLPGLTTSGAPSGGYASTATSGVSNFVTVPSYGGRGPGFSATGQDNRITNNGDELYPGEFDGLSIYGDRHVSSSSSATSALPGGPHWQLLGGLVEANAHQLATTAHLLLIACFLLNAHRPQFVLALP